MNQWKEYKLGEILNFKRGYDLPNSERIKGSFPVVSSAGIIDYHSEFKKWGPGVITGRYGTIGKVFFVNEPYWPLNTTLYVTDFKDNYPKFIYYFLQVLNFEKYSDKSTVPGVNRNHLHMEEVLLPPLPEQRAIASVLSSLDDKIDLLHRQNATLEALAETLFRQWFVEEAEESWEKGKLGDFVETNIRSIDKSYKYEQIEYLDTGSLNEGRINSTQSMNIVDAPSRAKRLVKHNDILISTVRPDQKHFGIIKNPIKNLVVSTGFCVITCTDLDPHFVYLLLTNDGMTEYLHTIAEGSTSTYPSLKPSDIEKIEFLIPPSDKLKEFGEITSNFWSKINVNHTQIRTLTQLHDTLLPKLMSGGVRVRE